MNDIDASPSAAPVNRQPLPDGLWFLHRRGVHATANAAAKLSPKVIGEALKRHLDGDWGAVSKTDRQLNEIAHRHGGRIISVYATPEGVEFWIISDALRGATTTLMPEDY